MTPSGVASILEARARRVVAGVELGHGARVCYHGDDVATDAALLDLVRRELAALGYRLALDSAGYVALEGVP